MLAATQKKNKFNYSDYLTWPNDERWEIIKGEAFNMSPAPSPRHQKIITKLAYQFENYFQDKGCDVYIAPFDVRFAETEQKDEFIETVVQPDISVVCDDSKIDDKGCRGAPDLIVEILSVSTATKDITKKFDLYEEQAVKEYWIVHPTEKYLEIYLLGKDNEYGKPLRYTEESIFIVNSFPELEINLSFFQKLI